MSKGMMPPPSYNPVWLDDYPTDGATGQQQGSMPSGDLLQEDTPHVLIHTPGGSIYGSQAVIEQHEVKVPLLNHSSQPECAYQSTVDGGYDHSRDDFPPPPAEAIYPHPDPGYQATVTYDVHSPADDIYQPTLEGAYEHSNHGSRESRSRPRLERTYSQHSTDDCTYHMSPRRSGYQSMVDNTLEHLHNGITEQHSPPHRPSDEQHVRFSHGSVQTQNHSTPTRQHPNGTTPVLPPTYPEVTRDQGQSQSRNTARLTLDGLELEIQVTPQNCYSGFAPETILRASQPRKRTSGPSQCEVVSPGDVGEIILSDVSRDVGLPPEDSRKASKVCRNCCLRVAAFLAHIGFFVCLAILGVQIPLKKQYDVQIFIRRHDENAQKELEKPYHEVALITASVFLFLCYLVALGESYTADNDAFVNNVMGKDVLRSYIGELREQVPLVGWDVICYHLETRQVTRTTRDRWGNETTSTTEEDVKVMTHRETLRFPFRICKDISGDIGTFKGTAITEMEFHQMYGFLDMATAQKFNQIKERLKERNRYRDEKMEFKEVFAMDNLKAHVTVFGEYGCLRQLMRPKVYCFFSCFLFSWPFRLILKMTTKKKKYTVIKVLGL